MELASLTAKLLGKTYTRCQKLARHKKKNTWRGDLRIWDLTPSFLSMGRWWSIILLLTKSVIRFIISLRGVWDGIIVIFVDFSLWWEKRVLKLGKFGLFFIWLGFYCWFKKWVWDFLVSSKFIFWNFFGL